MCNNPYTYGGGVALVHVRVEDKVVYLIYLKYASYFIDTNTISTGYY